MEGVEACHRVVHRAVRVRRHLEWQTRVVVHLDAQEHRPERQRDQDPHSQSSDVLATGGREPGVDTSRSRARGARWPPPPAMSPAPRPTVARGSSAPGRSKRRTAHRRTAAPKRGTGWCRTGSAGLLAVAPRRRTPEPWVFLAAGGGLVNAAGLRFPDPRGGRRPAHLSRWDGVGSDRAGRPVGWARPLGSRPADRRAPAGARLGLSRGGRSGATTRSPDVTGRVAAFVSGWVALRSPSCRRSTSTPTSRSPCTWSSTWCSRSSRLRCSPWGPDHAGAPDVAARPGQGARRRAALAASMADRPGRG